MPSRIGSPLPRPAPSWFWFVVAALAALWSTWSALFGGTEAWVPATFAGFAALVALAPKLRNPPRETVQVDDEGVLRVEGALREQIRWDEVTEIRVINAGGAWRDEVYFALGGASGQGCVVPHEAALRTGLLEDLRARFAGLDDEALAEAMASTGRRHFVIWGRAQAGTLQ